MMLPLDLDCCSMVDFADLLLLLLLILLLWLLKASIFPLDLIPSDRNVLDFVLVL